MTEPISKTYCPLAWDMLFIDVTGKVAPCCEYTSSQSDQLYSIAERSIDDAINSPGLRAMRRAMLAGERPEICNKCFTQEDARVVSKRMHTLDFYTHYPMLDIADDGSIDLDEYAPSRVDLRLSNTCNLKCRICNSHSSSKWYEEEAVLRRLTDMNVNETGKFHKEVPITDILKYLHGARRVYIAGGEPLIMPEYYEVLDYLIDNDLAQGVSLAFNTNLTTTSYKGILLEHWWNKFKEVRLSGSIDGVGTVGDYNRTGADSVQLHENYKYFYKILTDHPGGYISISIAVSVLNIHHLREYLTYIAFELPMSDFEPIAITIVMTPAVYDVRMLPAEERRIIVNDLLEIRFPLISEHLRSRLIPYLRDNTVAHDGYLDELKYYLDANDVSSGTLDWREQLPLLADMFKRYGKL